MDLTPTPFILPHLISFRNFFQFILKLDANYDPNLFNVHFGHLTSPYTHYSKKALHIQKLQALALSYDQSHRYYLERSCKIKNPKYQISCIKALLFQQTINKINF
jgi:hypothetical protein